MLRIGLCGMVVAAFCLPALSWAQGADDRLDDFADREGEGRNLRPTLQSSGLDEDDDLLDPSLDDLETPAPKGAKLIIPPHAIKMRIDDESASIGRAADTAADEMTELGRMLQGDRNGAMREIERRTKLGEANLAKLEQTLNALEQDLQASEQRPQSKDRKRGTYGSAIVFKAIPRDRRGKYKAGDAVRAPGEAQFRFWQKLVLKSTGGLHRRLMAFNVLRANELKARADALSLSVERRYREYANYAVEEAVSTSRFAEPVRFDDRLNDLLLPGVNTNPTNPPVTAAKRVEKRSNTRITANFERGNAPLVLLPRIRGADGRVRVIVDKPLGGPFSPPSVPAGDED